MISTPRCASRRCAGPDRAVPVLAKARADRNADVRKSAVLAPTRHTDAAGRAYATRAL
ncbi:hypothetical protein ABZY01_07120 [Streptomyces anthocyanicus]|uniref:hypothetical protein n=1 Tax=Streptomyces TaxID=1883 RepID=UPI000B0F94B8|nr:MULTISPECIES: hypothetical protein [unclassified Streptomyces]